MANSEKVPASNLTNLEKGIVTLFSDGVKVIGLPKSVGEIYGLLYARSEPLSLDELVSSLEVSKGTGSQGLKVLRELGAVKEVETGDTRKTYYEADVELKSLVGGFIREEVRPHLKSAKTKLDALRLMDGADSDHLKSRLDKLDSWRAKAGLLLPLLQKILAS
jgi:DNA-binding transcriptional regulator GbsR (MarR family)